MRGRIGTGIAALLLCAAAGTAVAEDVTLTTYYPSPRGAYKELRVTDNTATTALSVTQTGTGAAVRVDDAAGDLSPFLIDANGNVGIGTAAPSAQLQVSGAGSSTVDLLVNGRIRTGDANNNGGIWLGSDNTGFVGENGGNIGFWTNGVSWNALAIDKASGNVGLGTTAPSARLHVAGAGDTTVDLRVNGRIRTGDANNHGGIWLGSTNLGFLGENGDNVGFWTNTDGWNVFQIDTPTGNVGIGTANPGAKLHIKSEAGIVGNIWLGDINEDFAYDGGSDAYFPFVHKRAGGSIAFCYPDSAGRLMTINNDGNINIGPNLPWNPGGSARALTVEGYIRQQSDRMYLVGSDGKNMFWINSGLGEGGAPTTNPSGENVIGFNHSPTFAGRQIFLAGTTFIGGNSPAWLVQDLHVSGTVYQSSDARLKTNIVPLGDVLGRLDQLRAVSFNWKEDPKGPSIKTGQRQIGLIGQEVERVFPELVSTSAEGMKSVDYGKLTSVLVEAIQELQAQNTALAARLQRLERQRPPGQSEQPAAGPLGALRPATTTQEPH